MVDLAKEELKELEMKKDKLEQELNILLYLKLLDRMCIQK